MTHQELLDKLAYTPHTDPNGKYMYRALRAVVKLHTGTGVDNRCVSCSHGNSCETIQTIEKELA